MADKRKLQGEMDRCFKKILEGVEAFDDTFQKLHNAVNANQREKYESDLKKEIKKLQRLRDQIKSWASSSEVKDKKLLLDYRKLIETQMEKFKVAERETKTKAYSKEGLVLALKIDPTQKAIDDTMQWLQVTIDTINREVERFESEIESFNSQSRRRKAGREKQDRIETLKSIRAKHRFHVKQLETLMRMLDNRTIEPEKIDVIRDDIEYYLESCLEPDFEDNDFIYEDMGLGEAIANNIAAVSTSPGKRQLNSRANSHSKDSDGVKSPDVTASTQSVTNHNHSNIKDENSRKRNKPDGLISPHKSTHNNHHKFPPAPKSSSIFPPSPVSAPAAKSSPKSVVLPQSQPYAVAAAGFLSTVQNHVTQVPCAPCKVEQTAEVSTQCKAPEQSEPSAWPLNNHVSAPDVDTRNTENDVSCIVTSVDSISLFANGDGSTTIARAPSSSTSSAAVSVVDVSIVERSTPLSSTNSNDDFIVSAQDGDVSLLANLNSLREMTEQVVPSTGVGDQIASTLTPSSDLSSNVSLHVSDQLSALAQQKQESIKPLSVANGEAKIQPFLGVAPLGPMPLSKEQLYQQAILESCWRHMPHPSDSERLRHYLPRNMCQTPSYYNQIPITDHDTLEFYLRLSTETLFFIFYYMETSKAQFMAARALRKQSWRFHTKYMMWFQRHEEPKTITDEYERGTYIYFDYEKWGQRKKEGFTFEYRYLEDRELLCA